MELDLELDRVGGPETSAAPIDELLRLGQEAYHRNGLKWVAYGYYRDAAARVGSADRPEVVLRVATSAKTLGRVRFALHELAWIKQLLAENDALYPLTLERLAVCHMHLGESEAAERYAQQAVTEAQRVGDDRTLAHAHGTLGVLHADSSHRLAIDYLVRSLRTYRGLSRSEDEPSAADASFEARTLLNLGHCYFHLEQNRSARRALISSLRAGRRMGLRRERALAGILLGLLDERENRTARAGQRWREAVLTAKAVNDKSLRFRAEFYLFRQALQSNNAPAARAMRRRLSRLAPWLPTRVEELAEFRRLTDAGH